MRSLLFIALLGIFLSSSAEAAIKVAVGGGMGSFTASKDELKEEEGPMSFGVGIEYDLNSRWAIGVEHVRSLSISPMGTSVGMTGVTGRWYYLSPTPNALTYDKPFNRARVLQQGFFPFAGFSAGFAQASILGADRAENIIALSIVGAAKAGVDYPLPGNFTLRAELNIGFPFMGTGEVSYYSLLGSAVFFW